MLRHTPQSLDHCRDQLDQRQHDLTRLQGMQRAVQDFDHTNAPMYQPVADLEQRLNRHWTDVVVAAAQAGDPYAYGRDRLEHAYQILLEPSRTRPNDKTV
jgi:hypothetical protein